VVVVVVVVVLGIVVMGASDVTGAAVVGAVAASERLQAQSASMAVNTSRAVAVGDFRIEPQRLPIRCACAGDVVPPITDQLETVRSL
jgi:type IV secretory pathway protease TraF